MQLEDQFRVVDWQVIAKLGFLASICQEKVWCCESDIDHRGLSPKRKEVSSSPSLVTSMVTSAVTATDT